MLALNSIEVIYDHVILVLKGVSLAVEEGRITTLLGANGAGKTTTLKAVPSADPSAAGRDGGTHRAPSRRPSEWAA